MLDIDKGGQEGSKIGWLGLTVNPGPMSDARHSMYMHRCKIDDIENISADMRDRMPKEMA